MPSPDWLLVTYAYKPTARHVKFDYCTHRGTTESRDDRLESSGSEVQNPPIFVIEQIE